MDNCANLKGEVDAGKARPLSITRQRKKKRYPNGRHNYQGKFFFNNIFFIFRNPTAFDNMNLTRSFDG